MVTTFLAERADRERMVSALAERFGLRERETEPCRQPAITAAA
jgi:hypothetical protein